MNLKESIKRILREETDIPLKIRRRILPKLIENAFQTALDDNTLLKTKPGSMLHKASFITFANFVIDDMVEYMEDQINMDGNSYYYGNDDAYIEEIRNPLLKHYGDRIKKRYDDIVRGDVFESVLEEETNPIVRKLFRRGGADKFNEIFESGLEAIANRYIKNKDKWYSMTLKTFRESVIPFVIVDLCTTYEDVCTSGDFYEQTLDFLMNNYSDRIKEKWEEINNINESVLKENRKSKETISDLVKEFGLSETSSMVGLPISQIVKISKHPINPGIANEILIENMIKGNIIDNYKEFIIHASSNGVFYWETNTRTGHFSNDRVEQITVAATPFWDGVDYTPVEIDWFTLYDKDMVNVIYSVGGEGDYFSKFTHQTNFETVEELNDWYNEVYLPGVYDIIMNKLLPKLYRRVDFELNPR